MLLSISIILLINSIGLLWCYSQQSDKVTDLFYSLSFFSLTASLWYLHADSLVHHLLFAMISLWSFRLGGYLFRRIHFMGEDARFNEMRKVFIKIAGFWSLQTVSIFILALPIIVLFEEKDIQTTPLHYIAIGIWALGLIMETVADQQKFAFRKSTKNKGQFIRTGLWSYLQHPNYTGEILCWTGVFLLSLPSLRGWEYLVIISPIWISILLMYISGIPLLQAAAQEKYGHLASYQSYRKDTPLLFPFLY